MKTRSIAWIGALIALAQAMLAIRAEAQVLVYRIEISKEQGINYHPFSGGFFTAPLLGGEGTFLLTQTDDGRTFTQSDGAGRLFTAVSHGNDKKAVVSATTGTGTAEGALVAFGDINHHLSVDSPTVNLDLNVARVLDGTAISADDESTATEPATDGSIGSAGMSKLRLVLDEPQTNHANRHGLSLSQTVADLVKELERRGYTNETPTPTPTPTTTTTATSTETTSGP